MTTFSQARAELVTAFAGVGNGATSDPGRIAPPCLYIGGDGAAVTHIVAGKFPATWRIVLVAGKWDAAQSAADLDALKQEALPILRALDGWRLESLGRDGVRTYSGGEMLTAELRGIRMIDA
jgi:hypothetical protein